MYALIPEYWNLDLYWRNSVFFAFLVSSSFFLNNVITDTGKRGKNWIVIQILDFIQDGIFCILYDNRSKPVTIISVFIYLFYPMYKLVGIMKLDKAQFIQTYGDTKSSLCKAKVK